MKRRIRRRKDAVNPWRLSLVTKAEAAAWYNGKTFDYLWDNQEGPSEIPKPGIDAFLAATEGQFRIVWNDYQIAIVKR